VRVLGTALAGLSQSEKQFEGIMRFIDGAKLFSSGQAPSVPEDDLEDVMSGRYAERAVQKAAPAAQVTSLLGRGFIGGG
jgi:hypothetical protein